MVEAYILVTSTEGSIGEAVERLRGMEDVRKAQIVTGPYDILVSLEVEDINYLREVVVDKIRVVKGITDTTTSIVIDS